MLGVIRVAAVLPRAKLRSGVVSNKAAVLAWWQKMQCRTAFNEREAIHAGLA